MHENWNLNLRLDVCRSYFFKMKYKAEIHIYNLPCFYLHTQFFHCDYNQEKVASWWVGRHKDAAY